MTPIEPLARSTLKVGLNRGRPRIWIDGAKLHQAGFTGGTEYWCCAGNGSISLAVRDEQSNAAVAANPEAWHLRKVTGRPDGKPIVDISGATVSTALGDATRIDVAFYEGCIAIRRSAQNAPC